jgi:hypothetical protein
MTNELRGILKAARRDGAVLHGTCWGMRRNGAPWRYRLVLQDRAQQRLWSRSMDWPEYLEAVSYWMSLEHRRKAA